MAVPRMKIIILGSEYSGKTSLVTRFVKNKFNSLYQYSVGCSLSCKKMFIFPNNYEIMLHLWDISGAERYQHVFLKFCKDADAAIICYDVNNTESWIRARTYISLVQELKKIKNCLYYLCATKFDTVDNFVERTIQKELIERYAASCNVKKHFETSSKTNEYIDDMFQVIANDYFELNEEKVVFEEYELIEFPKPSSSRVEKKFHRFTSKFLCFCC